MQEMPYFTEKCHRFEAKSNIQMHISWHILQKEMRLQFWSSFWKHCSLYIQFHSWTNMCSRRNMHRKWKQHLNLRHTAKFTLIAWQFIKNNKKRQHWPNKGSTEFRHQEGAALFRGKPRQTVSRAFSSPLNRLPLLLGIKTEKQKSKLASSFYSL